MVKRILIVDDQQLDSKGIAVVLEKSGCRDLLFATSAQEGLAMAAEHNPDFILIDVVLDSGIDGFDICKRLRAQGTKVKIIMITGHLDAVNAKKAISSGADEIVEKVVGYKNLIAVIKDLSSR
jgi:two-component system, OmpR family, alkaline phosphatase synthesis response regulator PhoP